MWAADAVGHPNPVGLRNSDCLFIGQYVGTRYQRYGVSRQYIDDCIGEGVGVLLIFEEWSSQFLGGYNAARDCCARMMEGWNNLRAPMDGSVIPGVVILDPSPSAAYGAEAELQDWARGWNDFLPFNEFTGYGSKYSLDLAGAVAPKMTRRWGVRTWGYQNGGADMYQEPNIAAPIQNVDYNSLTREDMGQWEGFVTPPQPTPKKREHKMYIGKDGETYWLVSPGNGAWGMSPESAKAAVANGIPLIENPGWWHGLVGAPVAPVVNTGDVNVQLGDMVLNGTLSPK